MLRHPLVVLVLHFFVFYPSVLFAEETASASISILVSSYTENMNVLESAVKIDVPEGWHIYYKDPGDIGMATKFTWKGDVSKAIMHWPKPLQKVDQVGSSTLSSNTYEGTVILPVKIYLNPFQPDQHKASIEAHVEYSICNDICVPKDDDVKLVIEDVSTMKNNPEVATLIDIWSNK